MDRTLPSTAKAVDVRKRSADPPVKLACLACRSSRTRCDGQGTCTSCLRKGRQCIYIPSKQGGPRVAYKSSQKGSTKNNTPDKPSEPLLIEQYIEPGAGLQNLDDLLQDSEFIFDSIFQHGGDETMCGQQRLTSQSPETRFPVGRTYRSDRDILDAYYIYIHIYFPILPAPELSPIDHVVAGSETGMNSEDTDYEPSSPVSLAILAILSFIPHPDDPDPLNEEAVIFRRKSAQDFAQSALESIEIESEMPESSTTPAQVLSEDQDSHLRIPFHPNVPVELESIVALSILSVYEYAQRGNIKRMRIRAGQALMAAMNISLHTELEAEAYDKFTEARRRAWWMTYVCVCQGSIVSAAEPTISMNDPRFTTKYPTIESDPEAWPFFIDAQHAILTSTNAVIALNKALAAKADLCTIFEHNQELDRAIESLVFKADTYSRRQPINALLDSQEAVVADALKGMARIKVNSARIKLHRYLAFFDLPIFSRKHCDLKSETRNGEAQSFGSNTSPICLCSTSSKLPSVSSFDSCPADLLSSRHLSNASTSQPEASSDALGVGNPPQFGNHASARICLKSALNIARSFETLPYPNPSGCLPSDRLFGISKMTTPRTMPSFACCAMQSSYALLMIRQRTHLMHNDSATSDPLVNNLFSQLHQGLQSVLGALENYSIAFEALGGMRDQIKAMMNPSNLPNKQ